MLTRSVTSQAMSQSMTGSTLGNNDNL